MGVAVLSRILAAANLVYYALGGGLGHLTRALAIINALDRTGSSALAFTLVTNSPLAKRLNINRFIDRISLVTINSETELTDRITAVFQVEPKLVLVDTFPRGLMGELVPWLKRLRCPRLLIQRYLNPHYLTSFAIGEFVTTNYQACLRLADNLPTQQLHQNTYDLAAVTLATESTIAPTLFIGQSQPRLLFIDFGVAADRFIAAIPELFSLRVVTVKSDRVASLPAALEFFPASALFSQADLIVGGCGYNLFHEVRREQRPAIFLPQRQTYDDQFGRARGYRQASSVAEFQQQLMDWYKNWQTSDKKVMLAEADAISGAQQATAIINSYLK
jgi:hypothetical protein